MAIETIFILRENLKRSIEKWTKIMSVEIGGGEW